MKIYEIGTGYTSIPAKMGAATEIVVEELTRAFISKGIPVEIIDIQDKNRPANDLPIAEVALPAFFSRTDLHLGILHKAKRVVYSVALAIKLKKILKKEKERIVLHFHNQYNLFFFYHLVPKHLRKKAVIAYTVHSYIWHNSWESIHSIVRNKYFQECFCVKNSDHVFVLNEQTRSNLCQHLDVPSHNVHLIDNGVNTTIYHPLSDNEINLIKDRYGVSNKKVFIQIGSVCDRKNQLSAIQMLYPLMKTNPRIVYCYAGGIISNDYQERIRQFAIENNIAERIIYLGELEPGPRLNEIYNMAETMLFPSKAEGFSLVIIEAMAAGIPVVIHEDLQFKLAKKCLQYSTPDAFTKLIQNAILCHAKDSEASSRIRQSVVESYTWNAIAQGYLAAWTNKPLT